MSSCGGPLKFGGRKTMRRHRWKGPSIGHLKKGSLTKLGYSEMRSKTARHSSLKKAVKKFGPLSTFRKLNAVGTYTKRTSKGKSKRFIDDRNWVKKTYM
jgi:hypothetical protein